MTPKKIFILLVLFLSGMSCSYAQMKVNANGGSLSPAVINSLVNCRPYREVQQVNFFGAIINSVVEIAGVSNGYCIYKTYMQEQPDKTMNECRFSKSQLQEIYAASKKDPNSKETYSGNGLQYTSDPVNVVFTKFYNDSSTCRSTAQ